MFKLMGKKIITILRLDLCLLQIVVEMERVVRAVSRCATTYSRMRHNKELLR